MPGQRVIIACRKYPNRQRVTESPSHRVTESPSHRRREQSANRHKKRLVVKYHACVDISSLPAFTRVDLRCGAKIERFRAALTIRNVGDTRGYLGGFDWTSGITNSPTGPFEEALIVPRTFGLSLSSDF